MIVSALKEQDEESNVSSFFNWFELPVLISIANFSFVLLRIFDLCCEHFKLFEPLIRNKSITLTLCQIEERIILISPFAHNIYQKKSTACPHLVRNKKYIVGCSLTFDFHMDGLVHISATKQPKGPMRDIRDVSCIYLPGGKRKKDITCFIVSARQCSVSSPAVVLMLPWSATIGYCDGIVIELPIVARPLTLCGSSSVSELPESHYSKLVILASRQLCHTLLSSVFVFSAKLS